MQSTNYLTHVLTLLLLVVVNIVTSADNSIVYKGNAVSAPNAVYTELPLTISCPVDKGQRVRWAEELTISTRDTLKVIADYDGTSYEEVAKSKTDGVKITITKIESNEDFTIYCNAENDDKKFYKISVIKKSFVCPPKMVTIDSGDEYELNCVLKGVGTLNYTIPGMLEDKDFSIGYEDGDGDDLVAKIVLKITASPALNARTAMCLESKNSVCDTVFEVKYPVNKVTMKPADMSVKIGDEITCTGNGNPKSIVHFMVDGKRQGKTGEEVKMIIEEPVNEKSRTFTLSCMGENTFKGEKRRAEIDMEYTVIGKLIKVADTQTKSASGAASIVIGIIIALIVTLLIGVVGYFVWKSRQSQKIPVGAKRVPTLNEEYSTELKGGFTDTSDSVDPTALDPKPSSPLIYADLKFTGPEDACAEETVETTPTGHSVTPTVARIV